MVCFQGGDCGTVLDLFTIFRWKVTRCLPHTKKGYFNIPGAKFSLIIYYSTVINTQFVPHDLSAYSFFKSI